MSHFSYKIHVLASEVLTDAIYFPGHYIQNIRINYGRAKCLSSIKQVRQQITKLNCQLDGCSWLVILGQPVLYFSPSGDHCFPGAFRTSGKSRFSALCDLNCNSYFQAAFSHRISFFSSTYRHNAVTSSYWFRKINGFTQIFFPPRPQAEVRGEQLVVGHGVRIHTPEIQPTPGNNWGSSHPPFQLVHLHTSGQYRCICRTPGEIQSEKCTPS